MVVFTMSGVREHLMHEEMYQATKRIAYRGQVFSAPMNVHDVASQLEAVDRAEARVPLPHVGSVLANIVQL